MVPSILLKICPIFVHIGRGQNLGQILDKIWTKLGHLSKNCLNFVRTDIVQEHRKGYPIFDEHSIPPFQGACTGMVIAQNHANTIGTGLGRI